MLDVSWCALFYLCNVIAKTIYNWVMDLKYNIFILMFKLSKRLVVRILMQDPKQ